MTRTTKLKVDDATNQAAETQAISSRSIEEAAMLDVKDMIVTGSTNEDNPNTTASQANVMLMQLNVHWGGWTTHHGMLLQLYLSNFHNTLRADYKRVFGEYVVIKAVLDDIIKEAQPTPQTKPEATPSSNLFMRSMHNLDLKLPKFTGNYRDWPQFRDMFTSSVVDQPFTDVQRMTILLNHLGGQAAETVSRIPISHEGFKDAWTLLTERYDDDKELFRTFFLEATEFSGLVKDHGDAPRKLSDHIESFIRNATRANGGKYFPWNWLVIALFERFLTPEARLRWDEDISRRVEEERKVNLTFDAIDLKYTDFTDFLARRGKLPETAPGAQFAPSTQSAHSKRNQRNHGGPPPKKTVNHTEERASHCVKCKMDGHLINGCNEFKKLSLEARQVWVQKSSLCFKCLKPGHRANSCESKPKCKICNREHLTVMHREQPTPCEPAKKEEATANYTSEPSRTTLFATAIVEVQNAEGDWVKCRAFFDDGANTNCITQDCVARLGLRTTKSDVSLGSVTTDATRHVTRRASFKIRSRVDHTYILDEDALVIKYEFSMMPSEKIAPCNLKFIHGLELADPEFHSPAPIDLLLGTRIYTKSMKHEVHRGSGPIARHSHFGWLLTGECAPGGTPCGARGAQANLTIAKPIDKQLEQFWATEEICAPGVVNEEQDLCVQHFHATYKLENGVFTVRLPFNSFKDKLGNSREIALKRFLNLEQKLGKSDAARQATIDFMSKYLALGHMSAVPLAEEDAPAVFLPHHAVIKMTSTTTKHRQVFDASAKTSTGVALNQALMVGPTPQGDLFTRLLKFRALPIAITGDIAMMYRQILVDPADRDYQRIFWRSAPGEHLAQYRLNTVTYGTACAPFIAIECLRELARLYAKEHPLGSEAALNDFYVDDLVSGAETEEEAIALYEDVTALLKKGNFELRKWASNSLTVLSSIPGELHDVDPSTDFESSSTRTLGIQWNHATDCFRFDYTALANSTPGVWTKRTVLSVIAGLFDPLGLLGPVIAKLKMLLQDLWRAQLDWDDPVTPGMVEEFQGVINQLPELAKISIPRCVTPSKTAAFDLHGFCDASEKGYAACLYVVTYDAQDQVIDSRLLTSKSKVAPVEKMTIPRLELNAAVLLGRLTVKVKDALPKKPRRVYAWSDSTTVIHWINAEIYSLKPYVHNRVKVIVEHIPAPGWSYVNTKQNPADCASRGIAPCELIDHHLWWSGPSWLKDDFEGQRNCTWTEDDPDFIAELKKPKSSGELEYLEVNIHLADDCSHRILERPRRYTVMIRARALVERVLRKRSFKGCARDVFSVEELRAAEKCLIRAVQATFFKSELESLRSGEPVDKKSHLAKLSPFVKFPAGNCFDDNADGIIRVGGRLANSDLCYDSQHPVILPCKSPLSEALGVFEHKRTLHGGPTLLQSVLGERFWIIGVRKLCRKIVWRCCLCVMIKARATEQLMADLPLARVQEARPFTTTGVDYAGPVDVKDRRARGYKIIKGYIAVFVCFVTKAIHLEFASDLSTEEFIAAFQRFVATRGLPATVQSDNGTNFVGAANEFAVVTRSEEWMSHLATHGVKWKTNTPSAPHHGGLWEAGVKSAKKHLVRSFHNYPMLPVEWFTALKRIEACLNSRPLLPLPSDTDEVRALTPGHFLIGSSLLSPPEYDLTHLAANRLDAWQRVMQRVQGFWNRWRSEYLSTLQQRPKWWIKRDFAVNAPCILKEPNKVTCRWDLGYIKEVYPGADGVVRSVLVKTLKGEYLRPVTKLCLLPYDGEGETAPGPAPSADAQPSRVVKEDASTRGGCSGQP